jgi:S1-C subfamily serine protease
MALFLLCCARAPDPVSPKFGPALPDAAYVLCFDGKDSRMGSGVIVSRQRVLTAAHVVSCGGQIYIALPAKPDNLKWLPGVVEAVDFGADVARVWIQDSFLRLGTIELGPAPPDGAWVCVMTAMPKARKVCGLSEGTADGKITHTAKVVPGNSGSGMFDSSGRLVGIVITWIHDDGKSKGGTAAAMWPLRCLIGATE